MIDKEEKKILIELICNEQTHIIIKDHTKYESEKYKKLGDDFIRVKVNGIEYVIDSITHEKTHTDSNLTHLCLLCRDGGSGNIKR